MESSAFSYNCHLPTNRTNSFDRKDLSLSQLSHINQIDILLQRIAKKYPKKYTFIAAADSQQVYFILEGQVKIGKENEKGEITSFYLLQAGDSFGLEKLSERTTAYTYAETLMDTVIASLPVQTVKELMRTNLVFNEFVLKQLFSKVERLEQHFEGLLSLTSRQRIIRFLLSQMQERGQRLGYEHVIWNFYIHRDIAVLTKSSRQTVTTVLNNLKRKGILDFNRRRLLIRDLESLKQEALIAK
ncbi:MAG: Crp/Fnr family transcriptional regulator [Bacteroidota bacterium]